jgi:hypothetical protein
MDSATKQDAVVAEVTPGTTPASPAFKLLRSSSITGSPQRGAQRSPERLPNRQVSHMVSGLAQSSKTINMPFARDAATDILLESLFFNAWATDVLKIGQTKKAFTLEEKYAAAAYRRLAGSQVDSLRMSFPLAGGGDPGTMVFSLKALGESTAGTALGSSTYADPTPDLDPVSSIDITVNDLFGISSPKIMSLDMTISNSLRDKYAFGSPSPFDLGAGQFDVSGTVQIYFSQLTDYSAFTTRQTGLSLDLIIGSVEDSMDNIVLNNVDVWNPDNSDPGPTGDVTTTLNFSGRYDAGDGSTIVWTRNFGLES